MMKDSAEQLFALHDGGGCGWDGRDRVVALVRTLAGHYELRSWHERSGDLDIAASEQKVEEAKPIECGVAEKLLKELRSLSVPLTDMHYHGDAIVDDGGYYKLIVGDEEGGVACFWSEDPGYALDSVRCFASHVWNVWDDEPEDDESDEDAWIPPRAYEVIKYVAPLYWEGYAIKEFLEHDYLGKLSCGSLASQEIATKMFGRSDMELAWLYFCLQRADKDGYSVPLDDVDKPEDDAANKPSWYHLLFWETADLALPDCFRGKGSYRRGAEYETFKKTDEFREILDYAARALSGMAKNGKWQTHVPKQLEPKRVDLVTSLHESSWIGSYRRGPAQTLALSFKAAGYLNVLKENCRLGDGDAEEFLKANFSSAAFAARLRGERSLVPEDLWEARLMLFVLCRWMLFSEDRNQADPLEFDGNVLSRVFALLYLRLYRKGLDASHFTRSQFRKDWEAIPFAEKEAYAARCRNHLLKTRNEMWLRTV